MENISQSTLYIAIPSALALLLAYAMGIFSSKNHMPVEGKTVLITGASQGMGRSAARQLAAKGANVILVARSTGKLEEVLLELKAAAKNPETQRFHYICADVSTQDYAGPVIADAIAWNHGKAPDIVWCIAGISTPALFLDMPLSMTRRNMDVNFYGAAEMSHAILKEWLAPDAPVEQVPKHLILTASVVSFYTIVGYGPYAPSKWALRGLADTLAQEVLLYPQNVEVHVVYPGTILSPGLEVENTTKPEITHILEKDDPQMTPDETAAIAIRGLERGHHYITVALLGHLMKWGALGGTPRNSWIIDTVMQWIVPLIWIFVLPDILGKIKKYGKEHGHPSTWVKKVTGGKSSK